MSFIMASAAASLSFHKGSSKSLGAEWNRRRPKGTREADHQEQQLRSPLSGLLCCQGYSKDMGIGAPIPHEAFRAEPPRVVKTSRFYVVKSHHSGARLDQWTRAGTCAGQSRRGHAIRQMQGRNALGKPTVRSNWTETTAQPNLHMAPSERGRYCCDPAQRRPSGRKALGRTTGFDRPWQGLSRRCVTAISLLPQLAGDGQGPP